MFVAPAATKAVDRTLTDDEDDSFERVEELNHLEPCDDDSAIDNDLVQEIKQLKIDLANSKRTITEIKFYRKTPLFFVVAMMISISITPMLLPHDRFCSSIHSKPDAECPKIPECPTAPLASQCPKVPSCPVCEKCAMQRLRELDWRHVTGNFFITVTMASAMWSIVRVCLGLNLQKQADISLISTGSVNTSTAEQEETATEVSQSDINTLDEETEIKMEEKEKEVSEQPDLNDQQKIHVEDDNVNPEEKEQQIEEGRTTQVTDLTAVINQQKAQVEDNRVELEMFADRLAELKRDCARMEKARADLASLKAESETSWLDRMLDECVISQNGG